MAKIIHSGSDNLTHGNCGIEVIELSTQEAVELIAMLASSLGNEPVHAGLPRYAPAISIIDRGVGVKRILFQIQQKEY